MACTWSLVVLSISKGKQLAINLICFLTVSESCPQINAPTGAPSRCFVAFLNECLLACLHKFIIIGGSYVIPGIESNEVALMPVLGVVVFPVVVPFVQIAFLAYGVGVQTV